MSHFFNHSAHQCCEGNLTMYFLHNIWKPLRWESFELLTLSTQSYLECCWYFFILSSFEFVLGCFQFGFLPLHRSWGFFFFFLLLFFSSFGWHTSGKNTRQLWRGKKSFFAPTPFSFFLTSGYFWLFLKNSYFAAGILTSVSVKNSLLD